MPRVLRNYAGDQNDKQAGFIRGAVNMDYRVGRGRTAKREGVAGRKIRSRKAVEAAKTPRPVRKAPLPKPGRAARAPRFTNKTYF